MKSLSYNDKVVSLITCEVFTVASRFTTYNSKEHVYEDHYELINFKTGKTRIVSNDSLKNYALKGSYALKVDFTAVDTKVPNGSSSNDFLIDKDGNIKVVTFDDTHIKLHKNLMGCQHDWVTWTGLHGTQTDCTKCKAVKKE